ncbi:hypothetical protein ASE45_11175 [Lysobacter sp. Root96]|nr:hypothetical protein ASE45_11175 [Lysobacter sp. Root96]
MRPKARDARTSAERALQAFMHEALPATATRALAGGLLRLAPRSSGTTESARGGLALITKAIFFIISERGQEGCNRCSGPST